MMTSKGWNFHQEILRLSFIQGTFCWLEDIHESKTHNLYSEGSREYVRTNAWFYNVPDFHGRVFTFTNVSTSIQETPARWLKASLEEICDGWKDVIMECEQQLFLVVCLHTPLLFIRLILAEQPFIARRAN